MNTSTLIILFIALIILILMSAFFSCSETGMMALNRYRLRHLARRNHKSAIRVSKLLERPDRLLGVILIGNTFATIFASSITTFITLHYFGSVGIAIASFLLTFIILILGEVTPKTFAAIHPLKVSFFVSYPLIILLKILYPIVWFSNAIANGTLKLFRVNVRTEVIEHLTSDELSTLVREAGKKIPASYQFMLLGILELEKVTVDDVMVPRNEIVGINLEDNWESIRNQLMHSRYTRLPVYTGDIDQITGFIHMRVALNLMTKDTLNKTTLIEACTEPYYIPESTPLHIQLINFRNTHKHTALAVDEYGDIQGLVTLEDILEEIVGEFATGVSTEYRGVSQQSDQSYLVEAGMNIRDLNKLMDWHFDTSGPKTLSGLIIEHLEILPKTGIGLRISGYPLDIVKTKGNRVKLVRIYPELRTHE